MSIFVYSSYGKIKPVGKVDTISDNNIPCLLPRVIVAVFGTYISKKRYR